MLSQSLAIIKFEFWDAVFLFYEELIVPYHWRAEEMLLKDQAPTSVSTFEVEVIYFPLWEEDLFAIMFGSDFQNHRQKKSIEVAIGNMLVFSVLIILPNF